jgi:GNAT superfamily N-acetyltransferase
VYLLARKTRLTVSLDSLSDQIPVLLSFYFLSTFPTWREIIRPLHAMIEVKQATLADLVTVSSILKEAADWLRATGRPMWRDDELDPERIHQDVAAGLFNLGHYDGVPAGTIKFQLEDRRFWPDFPGNDAAYVHRVAVRRQFAGKGVSTGLLAWAVSMPLLWAALTFA